FAAAPPAHRADEVRRALPRGTRARGAGVPFIPHAADEGAVAEGAARRIGWGAVRDGDADGDHDRAAVAAGAYTALTQPLTRLRHPLPAERGEGRRSLLRIRGVEVLRADLDDVVAEVVGADGKAMVTVDQLGRIHREAPAGIDAVEDVRILRRDVGAREAVLRRAVAVAVDDDVERRQHVRLSQRPALERH